MQAKNHGTTSSYFPDVCAPLAMSDRIGANEPPQHNAVDCFDVFNVEEVTVTEATARPSEELVRNQHATFVYICEGDSQTLANWAHQ